MSSESSAIPSPTPRELQPPVSASPGGLRTVLSAFSPVRNLKQLFVRPADNFPVLDGFRALSMLMILVFHSFAVYALRHPDVSMMELMEEGGLRWSWVWNTDKSVDIFFMISGFLITGILLRQIDRSGGIRMGNFYLRRFLRLTPAYWLVLGLYLLLGLTVVGEPARSMLNLHNVWANALYVNNFLHLKDQAMNWTWTLAVEEQFYLLYPLVLLTLLKLTRNPLYWLWGLFALSFLIRLVVILSDDQIRTLPLSMLVLDRDYHSHNFTVLYDNLYTRYGALLSGCLGAFYYYHHEEATKRFLNSPLGHVLGWLSLACMVGLLVAPVTFRTFDDYHLARLVYQTCSHNLFAISLTYLILLCVEKSYMSRMLNFVFAARFWYPLAQLSYSMYLLHIIPIQVVVTATLASMKAYPDIHDYTHWEAMCLVALFSTVFTILGAVVIYLLVERPIMNLRK